ncbi:putative T-complex protein 1 subunit eta, partial [Zancudomyces culisetae]
MNRGGQPIPQQRMPQMGLKMVTTTNHSAEGGNRHNARKISDPQQYIRMLGTISQDAQVGDGTTTVVLLAGAILGEIKELIEEERGEDVREIIRGLEEGKREALKRLEQISIQVEEDTKRDLLQKCAETTLSSKVVSSHRQFFAKLAVDVVLRMASYGSGSSVDLEKLVGIKKIPGGAMQDSFLIDGGVGFAKTFSYAGFEQQPKHITNPKIACLNIELELKAEKDNAEVRVGAVADYSRIVDAEYSIIFSKLQALVDMGATVVLSKLPIGDLATQFFADRNIFCAGRVP